MKLSPLPENEISRLAALDRYKILDSEPEKDFNDIVELASQLCNCPISLITLIDQHRQWFKAKTGLTISETDRNIAFCSHTIHYDDIMEVPDTIVDDRFSDNPFVTGEEAIRFYAGMPIITRDGYKLGSLCVLDNRPRNLTPTQLSGLRILGKQVTNLLDLRLHISSLNNIIDEKTVTVNEILERVSDGFVALNQNWIYTYANHQAEKMLNKPQGYLVGKHIWTEFLEGVGQPFQIACENAMAEQKYIYLEEYYPTYGRWFEIHLYPSASGLSIYFRDITKKKEVEISLHQSEEKFRSVVENASDGIFISNPSGEYLDVNSVGCRLLGYKKEEILKLKIQDLVILEQNAEPLRFNELREGKSVLQFRKMRSKEGVDIPVEISAKILPDGRMLGIVRDHSARLLAERKLFKEKDLSDQIINSLPGIFYLSDQTPRLIRWNKKLEMISGYTADELPAIKPLTLFDIADHDRMMRAMKKAYEDGYGSAEGTLIAKDATRTTYFFTAVRIDYEGRPAILGTGIDITDQKKAQEQILKANELFQLVTRATHDVVWDWDLRTDERWWNENFYSLLGDQQETGQNNLRLWMNALHEEDRERVISAIQYAIQNHHDDWKDEYQFTKKDGTVLFIYDRGYILYDDDGKPYRMIGAMMDVTKRKQAELELTAKESRLRAILTVEPECIKLLNEKGELLEINPAGLAMIEAENEDQVMGQRLDALVLKPYKSLFNQLIKDVFSGRSGKLEFEITGLKGTNRWLETNAVPFRSSEGKIISLLGVTRDITERKRAEQSLREAEERYRKIFQNATEGIYQSTPEGKFITANHALAKMFGYDSASELISEISSINTQIYADPQQREHIMKLLEKQDRVTYFEMKAFKKDKRIIWVRDHIHAIRDQRGNIQYFEGTLEDITERKNAEEKLTIQFDQLQKTNYELDRFVYSVSHDLRAPLSSIMGLVNIAEMDNPNQNQLKYLQLIRESVLRLDGFIHDILDYSRNTRQEITIAKVDLNDILRSIQNNLSHLKGMENLNVKMDVGNNVIFNSDPVRLKIILSNLFSNAIKYQDVTKKESYLSIQATIDAQQCNIFFKDNGVGIDQTQINHVFDMFYRASNLSNGSGLGLYIARETVARLGGTISVKSELGKFSQFEICIPNLIP